CLEDGASTVPNVVVRSQMRGAALHPSPHPCHENKTEKPFDINETVVFIHGGARRAGVRGVSPAGGEGGVSASQRVPRFLDRAPENRPAVSGLISKSARR